MLFPQRFRERYDRFIRSRAWTVTRVLLALFALKSSWDWYHRYGFNIVRDRAMYYERFQRTPEVIVDAPRRVTAPVRKWFSETSESVSQSWKNRDRFYARVESYFEAKKQREEKYKTPWIHADDAARDSLPVTKQIWSGLDLRPGLAVADIGSGGGYFTFKLANSVGPTGHVFATDVDDDLLGIIDEGKKARSLPQISTVKVEPGSFGLAAGSVDRILVVNVYLFEECSKDATSKFFREAYAALRPGGKLVIANDFIHKKGWQGGAGTPLPCSQDSLDEVIRLAENFRVEAQMPLAIGTQDPLELPGYLITFARVDSEKLSAGDND